jgi:subtilisin family serine protease
MKLLTLLLCLICSLIGRPAHAQSNPPLSVRVIVTLREQADLSRFQDGDPSLRRRQIVAALKATAAGGAQAKAGAIALRSAVDEPVTDITPFWIFNGFAVTASPNVIAQLAASPDVLRVTSDDVAIAPAGVVTASADVEANLAIVNAPALWRLGWRGQGIVVANLDTGVDMTHPDLAASWRGGTNSWFDPFGQHPVTPSDVNGHGTATMGVMVGGSAGGTAIGVAPDAKWIAAKVFDDRGR